ncbi:MAG: hypothetical protein F7C36_00025 [Desulfurococcales archaeon]|nr:hypothetical protein [Desulfurococcales archaeon]
MSTTRKKSKGLLSSIMIILAATITGLVYKATGDPIFATISASLVFYPIPVYYLGKLRPYRALGAAILTPMVAGAISYIVLYMQGASPHCPINKYNILFYGSLSLITAGLSGYASSTIVWLCIIGSLSDSSILSSAFSVVHSAIGGLFFSYTTILGLVIARSLQHPHTLKTRTIFVIVAGTIILYVLYIGLDIGGNEFSSLMTRFSGILHGYLPAK